MLRCVFDTNVLIDTQVDAFHASTRLIQAVLEGELSAVVTHALLQEYTHMMRQRMTGQESFLPTLLEKATLVKPRPVTVTLDDPSDVKFVEAAVGGNADLIITSDHHLLALGTIETIRIVTPQEAWVIFEEEEKGSEGWNNFAKGIGLIHE